MSSTNLSFDDVFLIPQYSELRSRADVSTKETLGKMHLNVPIISAGMDSVTGPEMAIAMHKAGGCGVLHRFNSISEAISDFSEVMCAECLCMVSLGVGPDRRERAEALFNAGARYFVVDIAHGHSIMMRETLEWLRGRFNDKIAIMAGNVATQQAVYDLHEWGADFVKVGVSCGAVCKTRVVTGHGVPQFSCLLECSGAFSAHDNEPIPIVADGGIRNSGDIVKAIAAGAQVVMVGSLLAGTVESAAQTVYTVDGAPMKRYSGMASTKKTLERKIGKEFVPIAEGIEAIVPVVGSVANVIDSLRKGLQSGASYSGARTLDELRSKARWGIQTQAGFKEGTPFILNRS